jgi:hypothetical protein
MAAVGYGICDFDSVRIAYLLFFMFGIGLSIGLIVLKKIKPPKIAVFWISLIRIRNDFGSNRTELNRSNSSSPRQTALEYIFVFLVRSYVRYSEPNRTFYNKNTKIIKKFECGSTWFGSVSRKIL